MCVLFCMHVFEGSFNFLLSFPAITQDNQVSHLISLASLINDMTQRLHIFPSLQEQSESERKMIFMKCIANFHPNTY